MIRLRFGKSQLSSKSVRNTFSLISIFCAGLNIGTQRLSLLLPYNAFTPWPATSLLHFQATEP